MEIHRNFFIRALGGIPPTDEEYAKDLRRTGRITRTIGTISGVGSVFEFVGSHDAVVGTVTAILSVGMLGLSKMIYKDLKRVESSQKPPTS